MRDCSSCKNSAEKRPELREVAFDETPCFKCRPSEPEQRPNIVHYGNQFEQPSAKTWKVLKPHEEEYRMETFKFWLDAWTRLDLCDQKIITIIVQNPGCCQSELARRTGVSRQAVSKKVIRLKGKFPGVFV